MKNVISLPITPKQPDQQVVSLIRRAFPAIQRLTFLDAIALSGTQFGPEQDAVQLSKTPSSDVNTLEKSMKSQNKDSETNIRTEKTENTVIKSIDDYVFPLLPPHFSFIRMEKVLKARSPILRFWKIFGLHPRYGQKDILPIYSCTPQAEG